MVRKPLLLHNFCVLQMPYKTIQAWSLIVWVRNDFFLRNYMEPFLTKCSITVAQFHNACKHNTLLSIIFCFTNSFTKLYPEGERNYDKTLFLKDASAVTESRTPHSADQKHKSLSPVLLTSWHTRHMRTTVIIFFGKDVVIKRTKLFKKKVDNLKEHVAWDRTSWSWKSVWNRLLCIRMVTERSSQVSLEIARFSFYIAN